jgi:hypothetical protein
VIGKIEVSKMKGVLLIPLWRGARFWLHGFPHGRHLGGVFRSFSQLKIETRSWGISPKDAFAGKWVFFLALGLSAAGTGDHWSRSCLAIAVSAAYSVKIVYVNMMIVVYMLNIMIIAK